jgi:hypothetical protein
MSAFNSIQHRLDNAFIGFNNCFSIDTRNELGIIDYEGQSYLINEDKTIVIQTKTGLAVVDVSEIDKTFKILNAVKVGFIPIDGKKGLLRFGDSHCDFIFFDDIDFCFVELKLNATSTEDRAVNKNRKKGIDQLGKTIDLFDEKLEQNYNGLHLEAYLCTPKNYPRENQAFKVLQVKFLEEKGIELFETDKKICR